MTDPVEEVVTAEVEEAVVAEAVAENVVTVVVTADPEMLPAITSKLPPQPNEHL